jgi:hypothetical protein
MAQHIPTAKVGFPTLLKNTSKMEHIKKLPILEKVKVLGVEVMRLPLDRYEMNDEHGGVDEEVLTYQMNDKTYEVHFAEDMSINEVYLVV